MVLHRAQRMSSARTMSPNRRSLKRSHSTSTGSSPPAGSDPPPRRCAFDAVIISGALAMTVTTRAAAWKPSAASSHGRAVRAQNSTASAPAGMQLRIRIVSFGPCATSTIVCTT